MPRPIKGSSNRPFGIAFVVVLLLIALWPWALRGHAPYSWALALAALLGATAWVAPQRLAPLNGPWFRFGPALHRLVDPSIMALLYYGAMAPGCLIIKATGKDLLRLRLDRAAASHRIARQPLGPSAASPTKQF